MSFLVFNTFYHDCPLCGCYVDDGDASGICFSCLDRYSYLSSQTELCHDDKIFLTRYHDIQRSFYTNLK